VCLRGFDGVKNHDAAIRSAFGVRPERGLASRAGAADEGYYANTARTAFGLVRALARSVRAAGRSAD
jgi:hypothetical protein